MWMDISGPLVERTVGKQVLLYLNWIILNTRKIGKIRIDFTVTELFCRLYN